MSDSVVGRNILVGIETEKGEDIPGRNKTVVPFDKVSADTQWSTNMKFSQLVSREVVGVYCVIQNTKTHFGGKI